MEKKNVNSKFKLVYSDLPFTHMWIQRVSTESLIKREVQPSQSCNKNSVFCVFCPSEPSLKSTGLQNARFQNWVRFQNNPQTVLKYHEVLFSFKYIYIHIYIHIYNFLLSSIIFHFFLDSCNIKMYLPKPPLHIPCTVYGDPCWTSSLFLKSHLPAISLVEARGLKLHG